MTNSLLLPSVSLCHRELIRFVRQRSRIIGALITPIVFWLLIGGGMGHSFRAEGVSGGGNFIQYFFPGTVLMILLFTAIFSTISIIEDRKEGFLQGVLVAPVPRMAIVLGKVLGGTVLAFAQGLLFLLLAPTIHIHLSLASLALTMIVMLIVSFALTALGFCIAWRMSSTQGFHAIMNLFLMPMWFLSGALFPPTGAAGPLRLVMALNPLTYGLIALRHAIHWDEVRETAGPSLAVSLGLSMGFAVIMFLIASFVARKTTAADLQ